MVKRINIMLSTYNGEKFLNYQLESIYNQKTDCEIFIYIRDDGSTDRTIEIIDAWRKKMNIVLLNDKECLGAANSFWKLIKNVPNADFYAFVDQDDLWDEDKIERAISVLTTESKPMLWFSNCRIIDENGSVIKQRLHMEPPCLEMVSQLICGSAQGCSMVFNWEACEQIKKLELEYIPMHDLVVMECILNSGNVIYEESPLFSYRMHSNNVIAKKGKKMSQRIKETIIRWFGAENKYCISRFAEEIIKTWDITDENNKKYLNELVLCRNSISSRFKILNSSMTKAVNRRALRSYKIRVILGII